MTTTCALDELLDPDEPAEPVDDAPAEPVPDAPVPDPPDPPVPPVPPEPLPPELPPPDTCWPTDRSTDATTPVIGDVRLASASACLASVTWFSAAVTAVWSAVSCALVTPAAWSDESLAASVASVASAGARAADSDADLTVASPFPAVTFSPTVAETEVT